MIVVVVVVAAASVAVDTVGAEMVVEMTWARSVSLSVVLCRDSSLLLILLLLLPFIVSAISFFLRFFNFFHVN